MRRGDRCILRRYAQSAISNILALGGDPPRGMVYDKSRDSFQHAIDLVKFIRNFNDVRLASGWARFWNWRSRISRRSSRNAESSRRNGSPESESGRRRRLHCDAALFDNRDFLDFRERCALAGIAFPIIAGIMPITSISGFKRIAELAGGARFLQTSARPATLRNDPRDGQRASASHFALEQCHDLLDNEVAGIHFYTLNRSDATRVIFDILVSRGDKALRFLSASKHRNADIARRGQVRFLIR